MFPRANTTTARSCGTASIDTRTNRPAVQIAQHEYYWIADPVPPRAIPELNREGEHVARCTAERLRCDSGLRGAVRGKPVRTTQADDAAHRQRDLVDRRFAAPAPNRLWVADLTYVRTWSAFV